MVSLFILRRKEPDLERPFKVFYPWVPGVALILGLLALYSVIKYSVTTSLPFLGFQLPLSYVIFGVFGLGILYYAVRGSARIRPISEEFGAMQVLE